MSDQISMSFRDRVEQIDREEREARRAAQRASRAARAAPPARGIGWSTKLTRAQLAKASAAAELQAQLREQRDAIWAKRNELAAAEETELRELIAKREAEWGHKANGTAATHADHADRSKRREGAIARLYDSKKLNDHHVAYAEMIKCAAERVRDSVAVRTASLETRIDVSRRGGEFFEALGAVRMERAFTMWRQSLPRPALVLDIIVEDLGLAAAARRHCVHHKRAGELLVAALNAWPGFSAEARRHVDEDGLARAHARLN